VKIQETNKLVAWMLGVFPQWRPDKATTMVWASELPDVPAADAIAAVRAVQQQSPSAFPPGLFEIKSKLRGHCSPRNEAKIVFNLFWEGRPDSDPDFIKLTSSQRAQRAFRLAGGGYGQALTADKDWHERRFVDIYEGLSEREAINEMGRQRLGAGQGPALLEAGRENLEQRAEGDAGEGARA